MKKMTFRYVLVLCLLALGQSLQAQVDGLWVVTKVTVGNEHLTPVAKWVRLDREKQTSGNGWLQHTTGTFVYDKNKSTLEFMNDNEPNDDFGPFKVTMSDPHEMKWSRLEEGENVMVDLKRADEIPKSPSDEIHGLWGLQKASKGSIDITAQYDPQKKYTMFIQWTHTYVINTGTEKITGLWYVNAHRPELRFLRTGHEDELDKWEILITPSKQGTILVMKGISDHNKEISLVFAPLSTFPK